MLSEGKTVKVLRYIVVVLVVGLCAGVAAGRWAQPSYIPADRLIANAEAYITEEPNDPAGYYTLGRIHYLAFANQAFLVGAFNEQVPPSVIQYWWWEDYLDGARRAEAMRTALAEFEIKSTAELTDANRSAFYERVAEIEAELLASDWRPKEPTTDELIAHAGAAQWNLYRAAALDPNNALYVLGQASLGEQYLEFFAQAGPALMPPGLKAILLGAVKDTYRLAYDLSIEEDLTLRTLPIEGLRGIISYEAGSAFVRLWEAEESIPTNVQARIDAIKDNLATFETLPLGAVTPIVFNLEERSSLVDLLAPATTVSFDLDGDGRAEKRPWVKPTTGFLVWDSARSGKVTSGRQMFGSATWWMFFKNGYRAMDVLDDNRNGWLEASELDELSVWFDRNGNGISESGEVVPAVSLGITAIATKSNGFEGASPMCEQGLKLEDGRILPTYDWIAPAETPALTR